jgi:hypothetical protein
LVGCSAIGDGCWPGEAEVHRVEAWSSVTGLCWSREEESWLIKDLVVGGSVEWLHAAFRRGSGNFFADLLGNDGSDRDRCCEQAELGESVDEAEVGRRVVAVRPIILS